MTPLALTQGDSSGIGPDIALAAWTLRRTHAIPPFLFYADPALLSARAALLGLDAPLVETDAAGATAVFPHAVPVRPLRARVAGEPGAPTPADAPAAVESIERALTAVMDGRARALVTNPIAKHVLRAAGFPHPGHTEFLAALAARRYGGAPRAVMMIWSDTLAVTPATIHIPLKDAPGALTLDMLVETGRIIARDLRARFGVAHPRLAVSGLNPHAGEEGTMGREEIDIIAPAVAALCAEGIDATGPLPADTMFHPAARARYDVAICMTHDQALIPIKTLAFDRGVNVTLGLPFVRTSPDHGTAFALAGRGGADPTSLIEALKLADRLSRPRASTTGP